MSLAQERMQWVFLLKRAISILFYRNVLDWFSLLLVATCEVATQAEKTLAGAFGGCRWETIVCLNKILQQPGVLLDVPSADRYGQAQFSW